MIRFIKSLVKSLPPIRRILKERDDLRGELTRLAVIPAGHFYSPIPALEDVRRKEARIFDRSRREMGGVDLNVAAQLELLAELEPFYAEQPFQAEASPGLRYYFENGFFTYSDAIFLYSMMRLLQPKRIIEIGSGFSSFVMLDTNERFLKGRVALTFIEPFADRLRSRLTETDKAAVEIIPECVQDVALARFDALAAGDFLFVDSSHVAKVGGDVNHILFEILPRLRVGVFVHFHDMFFPFEYPKEWIEGGRFWNEDYFLRTFLQYNSAFKVRIWNQFLGEFYSERLAERMPLCMKNTGASLWLQRT